MFAATISAVLAYRAWQVILPLPKSPGKLEPCQLHQALQQELRAPLRWRSLSSLALEGVTNATKSQSRGSNGLDSQPVLL